MRASRRHGEAGVRRVRAIRKTAVSDLARQDDRSYLLRCNQTTLSGRETVAPIRTEYTMSLKRTIALALAAGAFTAAGAIAAEPAASPKAAQAVVTALDGNASALTYWIDRADGRHV